MAVPSKICSGLPSNSPAVTNNVPPTIRETRRAAPTPYQTCLLLSGRPILTRYASTIATNSVTSNPSLRRVTKELNTGYPPPRASAFSTNDNHSQQLHGSIGAPALGVKGLGGLCVSQIKSHAGANDLGSDAV